MEDDFAQSREPDDLFADEIEPADDEPAEELVAETPVNKSDIQPQPQTQPQAEPEAQAHAILPPPQDQQHQRGQGRHNPRGRGGRPPRDGARGGHSDNAQAANTAPPAQEVAAQDDSTQIPSAPQPPSQSAHPAIQEQRPTSVRGDRSATGPAKPTKRTEAELNELMKSMQLKNAAKTEAYERAEKDQASFLQREKQAAAKRLEERKAIREQDMERAKNRERKIKAQMGREWDSEKQESDIVDRSRGNSSMYARGAHGAVPAPRATGLASSRYGNGDFADYNNDYHNTRDGEGARPRGGRGARGGGGRGGRGRGTRFDGDGVKPAPAAPPADQDFPALPVAAKSVETAQVEVASAPTPTPAPVPASTQDSTAETTTTESAVTESSAKESTWADEMATAEERRG